MKFLSACLFAGVLALCTGVPLRAQTQQAAAASPGFAIEGVVVNSVTGQPVREARILIAPVSARSSVETVITGADGRFSFAHLGAGKYSIEGSAHGYREQGWNQHDFYATAVVVGRDLDASHIVFRLQPDAAIEGHITDEANEPVQHASVRLFLKNTEEGEQRAVQREQAETDDQGYYHIGRLAPGTYYVAVSGRPWYAQNYPQTPPPNTDPDTLARSQQDAAELDKAYPLTFYPDALDSSAASAVVLNAGEKFTADVTLQAMKAARLLVRTGDANDRAGVQVNLKQRVFDRFEPLLQGMTMSSPQAGIFEVSGVAPGHYLVEVRLPPGDKNAARGWYQEVDIAGDMELTPASSPGFADVSGILRFQGMTAVPPQVFLQMMNHETGENFTASIARDGQFAFRDDRFRPGSYQIVIGNAQGFSLQKLAGTGATVTGRTLEITTAGTVHLAGIASRGVGQVNGVAWREGKGVAGVMIVLVPHDPAHNQPLFRRDQSDSDGSFSLRNVVPGNYTVVAIDNGWQLEWANPAVLQRYLKNGSPIEITGDGSAEVKVQVQ